MDTAARRRVAGRKGVFFILVRIDINGVTFSSSAFRSPQLAIRNSGGPNKAPEPGRNRKVAVGSQASAIYTCGNAQHHLQKVSAAYPIRLVPLPLYVYSASLALASDQPQWSCSLHTTGSCTESLRPSFDFPFEPACGEGVPQLNRRCLLDIPLTWSSGIEG